MKSINFKELFKNKSVIYLSVVLGLLLIISVSYAYFSIIVSGNEEAKDITVTTGNLSLFYNSALVTAIKASSQDIFRATVIGLATMFIALGAGITVFKVQDLKC